MNTLNYQNYTARVEFDDRDNILIGRLLGIRDSVSFHADSVSELRAAFKEAVDDYLETCAKIGKIPEKPVLGNLVLQMPPEVQDAALMAAQAAGKSLDQWATEVLTNAVRT